jgi:hypothetical protein
VTSTGVAATSAVALHGAHVVELQRVGASAVAIVQAADGRLWRWSSSSDVATVLPKVASTTTVIASAIGPDGAVAALVRTPGGTWLTTSTTAVATRVASSWSAVAFTPSGQVNCFALTNHVAHQLPTLVTVGQLRSTSVSVTAQFGIDVPYGSSR